MKEVIKVLSPLKKKSPADYRILRNAAIAAFKKNGRMVYESFIDATFVNYESDKKEVVDFLKNAVVTMKGLPQKKNFDGQFSLVPSAVPFRRVSVDLATGISISYEEDIANLSEKIWSSTTRDGKSIVVIETNAENASNFVFKEMES
ncbi:hypothetical protein [Xanthomonas vesicatoria]|uniref:hypothetical protein n=1 Tax=Xanthomonas vesicatoria TaxID=56460 RepID=UPI003555EF7A